MALVRVAEPHFEARVEVHLIPQQACEASGIFVIVIVIITNE